MQGFLIVFVLHRKGDGLDFDDSDCYALFGDRSSSADSF